MNMSETIESEKEDNLQDIEDFSDVIEKSEELKEDYYRQKTNDVSADSLPDLSLGTWITGLSSGEIIDIKIDNDDNIILTVRISDNGNVRDITVRNRSNIYTEKNEIVRLLESENIKEGNLPKLLGREIPIYIDRYALPTNELAITQWKPYVPRKFDRIGIMKYKLDNFFRNIGYEGEFSSRVLALTFLIITLFWWAAGLVLLSLGMNEVIQIINSYQHIFFISIVLSFILTIYTPFIVRLLNIMKEKYVYYRNKNSVID